MVTKSGSILTDLAEGLANVESGVPCTSDTRFQLCSVSKQFTAAAVMLLVESGRLDLGEPVDQWLSGAPPQWRQVTLHHILSHTAGIPHWLEAPSLDPAEPMSIAQRLEVIQATPLRTEPGAQWILSLLQLTQTTLGSSPKSAARGYKAGQPVAPFDLDTMPGTGDIWSTAGDLTRFTTALHHGELITASSLRAMCTAHVYIDDDDDGEPRLTTTGYGYGMFTGIFAGYGALYHPGDNPGYQSLACWIPDRAASIVILVNDEAVSMTSLLRQLLPATLEP